MEAPNPRVLWNFLEGSSTIDSAEELRAGRHNSGASRASRFVPLVDDTWVSPAGAVWVEAAREAAKAAAPAEVRFFDKITTGL
jgi:hypothetical protein